MVEMGVVVIEGMVITDATGGCSTGFSLFTGRFCCMEGGGASLRLYPRLSAISIPGAV